MYAAEVPPTSVAKNGEARQLAQILKAKFIFVNRDRKLKVVTSLDKLSIIQKITLLSFCC
jgi:hypothetical protein